MHKWSRRRAHLSLLLSLFTLILLSTLLSNHTSKTIHSSTDQPPSFPTHTTTSNISLYSPNQWLPGGAGWSRACTSPRSYSPRRGGAVAQRKWWKGRSLVGSCDLFSGRWVHDERMYPLYNESECPWMSDQLACRKHGRPEEQYKHWRWQPHGCHLKRWNALEMLEKLRGKRLMFVGDSLNRGQWISMVCLLQSVIPVDKKSMSPNAALTIFKMEEYNATVEFYWAPLLVESNSDDPVNHRLDERIILPNKLHQHASQWENADILVFNSYLWWRSGPKIKLLWSRENSVCEEADGLDAMTLAMETWADWVSSRADLWRQRIFFVTMSPTHLWSREWNPGSEGNCYKETTPINIEGYWGSGSDLDTMRMVNNILNSLGSKVTVLNITQLSEYRKDGHPSIYRKFWETISPEQVSNPVSYSDCIHWCLPGVPDVWNELLFNLL